MRKRPKYRRVKRNSLEWHKFNTLVYGPVLISRATRRLRKVAWLQFKALRRIKKLLARQEARVANLETRRQVRTLKAAKRLPHLRVRNRDEIEYLTEILNPVTYFLNPDGSVKSTSVWQTNSAEPVGRSQWMLDYQPHLYENPPMNPVKIGQSKRTSLRASVDVPYLSLSKPGYTMRKSKWPLIGTRDAGQDAGAMQALTWSSSASDMALVKALAKVYENDVNSNEYIVEWRQVLGLLRDPLRTMKTWGRLLKRWTSRDSWMWIPQRHYRKLANGDTLVSKLPQGGVLMSMRTRKVIDPKGVSKFVVDGAVNRWLQYRYGIAPMATDITTVMGLWLGPKPACNTIRKSARHYVSKKEVVSFSTQRRGPFMFYFRRVRSYGTVYSATVYATRDRPDDPTSYQWGMHPSQWKRIIWNSLPYSFVADWAVDVDKWLTSQIEVPWIHLTGNCVTAKRFDKVTATCYKVAEVTYGRLGKLSSEPHAVCLYEAIERRINLPRPFDPPVNGRWLEVKNLATALALSINLVPKR